MEEAIRRKKVKEAEDNKAKTVKEGGTTAAASVPPPEQPRDRKSCEFHVSKVGSSTDIPGHEEIGDQPKQHIGSRVDVLIGKYSIKERIIGTSVDEKRKMRGQQERIMGSYADEPRVPLDQPKLIIGQNADEQLTLMSSITMASSL